MDDDPLISWVQQLVSGLRRYSTTWGSDEASFLRTLQSVCAHVDHKELATVTALALGSYAHLRRDIDEYFTADEKVHSAHNAVRDSLLKVIAQQPLYIRRELAMKGAAARLAHDPKQAAKAEAFKLWQTRREGQRPDLKRIWQFANECARRWEVSPDTVKRWCTQWEKEARARAKKQPC